MRTPIRVAIVGMGHIGAIHVRALGQMREFSLVAACDEREAHAGLLEQYEPRENPKPLFYRSYAELLEKAKVDTVIVATPNSSHFRIARDCLSAGVNVIVEKPACRTMAEMETLEATAAVQGRHLYYALHAAFGKEVAWAERHIHDSPPPARRVTGFTSVFTDCYLDDDGAIVPHAIGLDDCWSDSAINALSVLDRFVDLESIRPLRVSEVRYERSSARCIGMRTVYVGLSEHEPECVDSSIHTIWDKSLSRKTTTLHIGVRNRCIVMDHMCQMVFESEKGGARGQVLAEFTGDRLVNHYEGVLRDYLLRRATGVMNSESARRILRQSATAEGLRK